ncbi:uncharacterized skeletal organic matrix protein 5-like [Acropora muricata]|uniref:uncharacterized skeletal organic matrix protein 5-like n=1 Tax=Acropora millepora TaxID=45264 RepID=UPI001CF27A6E|nr:uncharacterized skeletal organic matrix protein 5-like [Acropora millepora]
MLRSVIPVTESSWKFKDKGGYRVVIPAYFNMKIAWVFLVLLICAAARRKGRKGCCKKNREAIQMLSGKIEECKADVSELETKVSKMEGTIEMLELKVENLTDLVTPPVPSSCQEVYKANREFKSGVYKLKIGSQEVSVYCQKEIHGCGCGGWTPVMKIDGKKNNFGYDSRYWSNKESFNPQGGTTGFDESETKLPSYWSTPFSKICLGMKVGDGTPKFILMNKTADSLYSLIADGKYRPTTLGKDTWKKLIETSSLQQHCNKQGFNSVTSLQKVRIGIQSNQEDNCNSCDSRIGFGGADHPDASNTCGNVASHNGAAGERRIKAMGYILVQ